jgi:hypothetical protein
VWAGLAIAVSSLPVRRRGRGIVFVATWAACLATLVLLCNAASSGRMFASFAALAAPGAGANGLLRAPLVFLAQLANGGLAVGLLVPATVVACVLAVRQRRLTRYHFSLFFCVPILVSVCSDPGVDYNHLLDLVVLGVIVTGHWMADWRLRSEKAPAIHHPKSAVAAALGWVLFAGWVTGMEPRLREVGNARYPAEPLARHVGADEAILTENPWIDVSRGRTPVVLDAFAFARMTDANPELAGPLLARIRAGSFDKIVLRHRVDDPGPQSEWGRPVLSVVAERYGLWAEAEGFYIYVPKR